jgi:tRNA-2-methylthio-N6-dimethylallyladenosine synthase
LSDKPLKFYIQTFGCQMNVADSNLMAEHLLGAGFAMAEDAKEAGLIIVNTCSVRDHAEHRALSYLGRLKPLKKARPSLKVIFAGCAAERLGKEAKKRFPIIDLVIGANEVENFPKLVKDLLDVDVSRRNSLLITHNSITAFIPIMRGCDNFCSYCIVPHVRGRERSRPLQEIIKEAECLVARGVKEVTLLGQNVNSYRGSDEPGVMSNEKKAGTTDFPGLLDEINKIEGLERVRFMTSHPKDLSDKLIEKFSTLDKLCEHLHLPLQSGSDAVLKRMNRGYTAGDYVQKIKKLRKLVPDISLTTDVLVGFPGETEEDFGRTLEFIKTLEFDFLFAFKYSSRPGTEASKFKDGLSRAVIEARLAAVLEEAAGISARKNAKMTGIEQQVLIEKRTGNEFESRTRGNKKVYFVSKKDLKPGDIARVKIEKAKVNSFSGTLVEHK